MFYRNKLLKALLSPFMMHMSDDTGGGGSADSSGFDMSGAVDAIGDGLGFGSESNDESNESSADADPTGDEPAGGAGTGADDGAGKPGDEKPEASPEGKAPGSAPNAGGATPPAGQSGVAPRTWRPEAAAEWEKLPESVKQEVAKREEDMFRGLEGYKQKAGVGDAFVESIKDYLPALKQAGADPYALTREFMQAHLTFAGQDMGAKQALLNQMISHYGLEPLIQDPELAPAVDPQVKLLQQTVARLESQLSGTQNTLRQENEQRAAAHRQQFIAEVEAFAKDPANIYYADVEHLMPGLIQSGTAKNLREAYDQAVRLNPVTAEKEFARRTTEAVAKSAAEARAKAEAAAKAAGANVRTRAKNASGTAPLGSIDDTLNEAFAKMSVKA